MRVSNLWLLLSLVGLASAATSPALDLAQARVTPHPTSVAHYSHSTVKPKIKHTSKHHRHHHHDKSKKKQQQEQQQRKHQTSRFHAKQRPGFPLHKSVTTARETKTAAKTQAPTAARTTTAVRMTTTRAPAAMTTTKSTTTRPATTVKTTTKSTTTSTTSKTTADSQPTAGLSALAVDSLKAHNDFRALHGAQPLVWDTKLRAAAQAWADKCVFEHGGGVALGAGENLAATSDTKASAASMIKMWTDESKDYDPANPQYSHFTQVVWKATSRLGCASAICNPLKSAGFSGQFHVCEYLEAGNVIGNFAENVQ